jgi:hypothetical protein
MAGDAANRAIDREARLGVRYDLAPQHLEIGIRSACRASWTGPVKLRSEIELPTPRRCSDVAVTNADKDERRGSSASHLFPSDAAKSCQQSLAVQHVEGWAGPGARAGGGRVYVEDIRFAVSGSTQKVHPPVGKEDERERDGCEG